MFDSSSSPWLTSRCAWASSRSPAGASTSPRPDPLEQAAVEHLLQPLDLLAGRRLAHVERRRGRRDAAAVDHGEEGAHAMEITS